MALTLTLDDTNSQAEAFGSTNKLIRTGIVGGLPETATPEQALATILDHCRNNAAGWPQLSVSTTANTTGQPGIFTRVVVAGLSHDSARIEFHYEPFAPLVSSALYIRVAASLRTIQTNKIPGTSIPIAISGAFKFKNVDDEDVEVTIPEDFVTIPLLQPMVRLELTQIKQGTPATDAALQAANSVGKVNHSEWFGRPAGHWMIMEHDVQISRYQGYHTRRASVMAKGSYETGTVNDWSESGVLRSQITGRFAKVPNDVITQAMGRDYEFGFIYPSNSAMAQETSEERKRGFVRVGPYRTTDLNAVFGSVFGSSSNYFQLNRMGSPFGL